MRRVFILVLTAAGCVSGQVHPAQNTLQPATPMVDIDMAPSPPLNSTPAGNVQRRVPDSAFVSVSDLAVPERARRELEKASRAFARQDWEQARNRLNKAISLYPSYAGAFNDLAVADAHLGDVEGERSSLEKAIALDDHFALAYFNFGRMDVEQGKLPEAETALSKAATLSPLDPRALVLLGYCQFLQKHFDDAVATSDEAHRLSAPHAVAHRVAARAFEQKREYHSAVAELNLFLQEQPVGPTADAARSELQIVQAVQGK